MPVVLFGNRNYDDALIELRDLLQADGFGCIAAGAFVGEHSFSRTLGAGRPDGEVTEGHAQDPGPQQQRQAPGGVAAAEVGLPQEEAAVPGAGGDDAEAEVPNQHQSAAEDAQEAVPPIAVFHPASSFRQTNQAMLLRLPTWALAYIPESRRRRLSTVS